MLKRRSNDTLKTILIVLGVVLSLAALAVAAYAIFKKHFKVTFDCDGDCCDCDDKDCFGELEEDVEPVCSCEE